MTIFKKSLSLILAIVFSLSLVACNNSDDDTQKNNASIYFKESEYTADDEGNVFSVNDYLWRKNKICATIAEAFYSNEMFIVHVAITNNTAYDKKITSIIPEYIRDSSGNDIIQSGSEFNFEEDVYLDSKSYQTVELAFEKDLVLLTANMDELDYKFQTNYEGCVHKGSDPEEVDNQLSVSLKKALFTSTDGLVGSIAIRNGYSTNKKVNKITFNLKTEEGVKLGKNSITINLGYEIEPGNTDVIKFSFEPSNVNKDITKDKKFNTFTIDYTID